MPLILITLGAIGVSILLIPSKDELAFLHMSDKEYSVARVIYERAVESEEDPSQSTIFPLAKLFLQTGETEKAIQILKRLLKDEPNNVEALHFLAQIYKNTQETDDYVNTLKIINKIKPDPDILREIASYNEFVQDETQEVKTLRELVEKEIATKEETRKLATLYLGENKIDEAIPLFLRILPEPEEIKNYRDLFFILDLLLKQGDTLRALHLAQDYINPKNVTISIELVNFFFKKGLETEALKLLEPLRKRIPYDSNVIEWQVNYLTTKKHDEEAFALLKGLAEKKQLSSKLEPALVDVAMSLKNPRALGEALKLVELKALPQDKLLAVGEYVLSKNLSQEARYMRLKLGALFIAKLPLLDLLLSSADTLSPSTGARQAAPKALDQISPKDRLRIARAFQESKSSALAKQILEKDFSFNGVVDEDAVDIAVSLAQMGLSQRSLLALLKRYPDISRAPVNFQKAWAILAAADGVEDKVIDWLSRARSLDTSYRLELFDIAQGKKLTKLSELLASALYKEDKSEASKIRLVEAYMANKSYDKAEPFLKELALSTAGAWEQDYALVLQKLGKTKALDEFWAKKASSNAIDDQKKREIAYTLLQNGNKKEAERIFFQLVTHQGPRSPDAQQLLDLWGKTLTADQVRWIRKKIEEAPLRQKKDWFKQLLYRGHAKEVSHMIEEMKLTDADDVSKLYIESLEATKDKQGIHKILVKDIEEKSDAPTLIRLVDLAGFSGNSSLEKKALKKLAKVDPNHPYALKFLAEEALNEKDYAKARQYFETLFKKGHRDVVNLYHYADVMRNLQGLEKAKIYYQEIVNKLKNSKDGKLDFDVIEAKSLYFIGEKAESIKKNKAILAAHKTDKRLRADLAHFFMDIGEIKEAEAILNE